VHVQVGQRGRLACTHGSTHNLNCLPLGLVDHSPASPAPCCMVSGTGPELLRPRPSEPRIRCEKDLLEGVTLPEARRFLPDTAAALLDTDCPLAGGRPDRVRSVTSRARRIRFWWDCKARACKRHTMSIHLVGIFVPQRCTYTPGSQDHSADKNSSRCRSSGSSSIQACMDKLQLQGHMSPSLTCTSSTSMSESWSAAGGCCDTACERMREDVERGRPGGGACHSIKGKGTHSCSNQEAAHLSCLTHSQLVLYSHSHSNVRQMFKCPIHLCPCDGWCSVRAPIQG
jgi:hypothetical protein